MMDEAFAFIPSVGRCAEVVTISFADLQAVTLLGFVAFLGAQPLASKPMEGQSPNGYDPFAPRVSEEESSLWLQLSL